MASGGSWFRKVAWAPFRAILPKHPLWRAAVIALPLLVLLALFQPVADLLLKVVDLFFRVLQPMLETPVGRVFLLLVSAAVVGLVVFATMRERLRGMQHGLVLSRHLDAVAALLRNDQRRSRDLFLRVQKRRRAVPADYPAVVQDAHLKLARIMLEQGNATEALAFTERVVEPGLPPELDRSLRQLRLQALRRQGQVLPETLLRVAEAAVEKHPKDYRLHCELRELHRLRSDLVAAARTQQLVVELAPPARRAEEEETLCRDATAAAEEALARGELDVAKKLQKSIARLPGPNGGLLLGAILEHKGDLRGACKAYGQTRSPEGLDRIAALLQRHPGAVDVRDLLECCPMQGTLLLVARELARSGQQEAARRAAQQAAKLLGPTPTVCAVLAEVLECLGQREQAQLLAEQAVVRLLEHGPRGDSGR